MSRIELHSGYWKLLFDDLPLTVLNSELKVIIYYDSIEAWNYSCVKVTSVFSARRSRVKRVRESLENSLLARIELIDSYAKVGL